MNLSPIPAISNRQESNQYTDDLASDSVIRGHIVKIMRSHGSSTEKIDSIMEIFAQMIEENDLQRQCVEELEKQNEIFSSANEKITAKQDRLKSKIANYSNKIQQLARENGLIGEESTQLQTRLDHLVQEKQALIDRQNKLEKENGDLTDQVAKLSKEKNDLSKDQSLLLERVKNLKAQGEDLSQQNEEILQLSVKLEAIEKKHKQLQVEANQRDKDETANKAILVCMGCSVLITGGLTAPILVGGGLYGVKYFQDHPEGVSTDQILASSKKWASVTGRILKKIFTEPNIDQNSKIN